MADLWSNYWTMTSVIFMEQTDYDGVVRIFNDGLIYIFALTRVRI